jgi:DNA topoisomerase I
MTMFLWYAHPPLPAKICPADFMHQVKKRKTSPAAKDTAVESDSDIPLAKKNGVAKKPPRASATQIGEESDSDVPLQKKLVKTKQKIEKQAEKDAKEIRANEKKAASKPAPAKKVKKEESSDDDVPLKKKAVAAKDKKVKIEEPTP